jgi:hypothetical protein
MPLLPEIIISEEKLCKKCNAFGICSSSNLLPVMVPAKCCHTLAKSGMVVDW